MKRLILLFIINFLYARIVVSTSTGEVAYSDNGGFGFSFINSPAPFSSVSDITSDKNFNLYALTEKGEIYKSSDSGVTWSWVKNLPLSDAECIWVDASDRVYVLSRSGDLWTNYSGVWELKTNLGLSDFIDFIPDLNAGYFLGITESGDIVKVNVSNFSHFILTNCGYSNIVSGATSSNSVYLLTKEGDVLKSADGVNYSVIGSLSLYGMVKIMAVLGDSLYAIHETGDIARSSDGVTWVWRGSANQLYISGLTSDRIAPLGIENYYFFLSYNEERIISFSSFFVDKYIDLLLYIRNKGDRNIRIIDAGGKTVYSRDFLLNKGKVRLRIPLSGFGTGIYFLIFRKDKIKFLLMRK